MPTEAYPSKYRQPQTGLLEIGQLKDTKMTIMKMNKLCKSSNTITYKTLDFKAVWTTIFGRSPNDNERRGGRSLTGIQ